MAGLSYILLICVSLVQSQEKAMKGISGIIEGVDAKTSTLLLKVGKGQEMFKADSETTITRDGTPIEFREIKVDERASITFDKKTNLARRIAISTKKATSPMDRKDKDEAENTEKETPPKKEPPSKEKQPPKKEMQPPAKEEAPKKQDGPPVRRQDMKRSPAGAGVRGGLTGTVEEEPETPKQQKRSFETKIDIDPSTGKTRIVRTISDPGLFEFAFTVICEWEANQKTDPSVQFRFDITTNQAKAVYSDVNEIVITLNKTERIKDMLIGHEKPVESVRMTTEVITAQSSLNVLQRMGSAAAIAIQIRDDKTLDLNKEEISRISEMLTKIEKARMQPARAK